MYESSSFVIKGKKVDIKWRSSEKRKKSSSHRF